VAVDRIPAMAGLVAAGLALVALFVSRISFLSTMPRPLANLYIEVTDAGLALAPDGGTLAYVVQRGDRTVLELRRLDDRGVRRLAGTQGPKSPFFSPDGRYLGFLDAGAVKRVSLDSFEMEDIADAGDAEGAGFLDDGSVLLGSGAGLFRISPSGKKEELLRAPVRSPCPIHGSEWVVVEVRDEEGSRLEVFSFASRARRTLVPQASLPRFSPPGHLLFLKGSAIWASRFDPAKAELEGGPVLMMGGVNWFDVAGNGTLAFRESGGPRPALRIVLNWDEELKRLDARR
jgi:serine/threonine-protein kinase